MGARERKSVVPVETTVFEYIESLKTMSDPFQIRQAFEAQLAEIGVTNFAIVENSRISSTFERGIIEDRMPAEWKQHYLEKKIVERDPTMIEAMNSTEPFLWSEVYAKYRNDKKLRRVYEEASEFKLNEGISVPIFGPKGYAALMTLAGAYVDVQPKTRILVHMMALYTHNHLVRMVRTSQLAKRNETRPLTPREVECLRWAADGKSDWEIGEILKIKETVAHEYIENAKRKFGVPTRVQAVIGALVDGQIRL
jgi:LuxR family transcriptional regulator, quorum-sensing system regulator BjaR1